MIEDQKLNIPQSIIDDMISHSQEELPNESCGYLAGKDGEIKKIFRMTNIDKSPEHFSFDPKEQFQVVKEARDQGLSLLSVYHSHPETPARLSEEDLKLLNDPNMVYIIVSMKEEKADVKGFKIHKPDSNSVEVSQVELIATDSVSKDNESNKSNNKKNNAVGGE